MKKEKIFIEKPSFLGNIFRKRSLPNELVLPSDGDYTISDFKNNRKIFIKTSGSNITLDYTTLHENEVYINNPNGSITINFYGHECKYDESKIIKCEELIYNGAGVLKLDDVPCLMPNTPEEVYINQPATCSRLTIEESDYVGTKIFIDGKNITFIKSTLIGQAVRIFGGRICFKGQKKLLSEDGVLSLRAWNDFDINVQELHLNGAKIEAVDERAFVRVDKLFMTNNSLINAVNGELDVEVVGMKVDKTSDITSKPENFRLARNDMMPKSRTSNIEYFKEVETCSEEIDGHSKTKIK